MNTYTIKTISEKTGLSHSALRYYEEIGLLTGVIHEGNKRLYTEEHVRRLEGILCFKNADLPIRKMLDFYRYEENLDEHIDDIIQLVEDHEAHMVSQIQMLQRYLEHIRTKVGYYHAVKQAIKQQKTIPPWEEYIKTEPNGTPNHLTLS